MLKRSTLSRPRRQNNKRAERLELTGRVFGRLTVLREAPRPAKDKTGGTFWLCLCTCGGEQARNQRQAALTDEQVASIRRCLAAGASQWDLAGAIGVARGHIANIATGHSRIDEAA